MADDFGVIRPVDPRRDLDSIHEIAVEAWMPIFGRYRLIVGDRLWQDVWGGWEERWLRFTPETWHGRGIVTELDGEVVGFATWMMPTDTLGEVGANAVADRAKGRGIGTRQVRWILDMFRSRNLPAAKVHTGMDPAHGPARAIYRKAGLRVGVTNSQYYNTLDEVARLPRRRGCRFRWAEPDDADTVRRLAEAAWRPIYECVRRRLGDRLFELAFPDALRCKAEEWANRVAQTPENVRLVEWEGKVVGFAVLGDEPSKRLGTIHTLAIDPRMQGQGIGASLCMDVFDVFRDRGLAYVRLSARLGEVTWATRQLCWNVGLYRELPSIDYYTLLP